MIPCNRSVTYARIVMDYWPQKKDPNRVHITVGGNLVNYPGELTTQTAELVTTKIKPIPELVIPCHSVHGHGTNVGFIPQSAPPTQCWTFNGKGVYQMSCVLLRVNWLGMLMILLLLKSSDDLSDNLSSLSSQQQHYQDF
jgi:hypothetical protein